MKGRSCVVVHRNMLFIIKWKILQAFYFKMVYLFHPELKKKRFRTEKGRSPKRDYIISSADVGGFRLFQAECNAKLKC